MKTVSKLAHFTVVCCAYNLAVVDRPAIVNTDSHLAIHDPNALEYRTQSA
jgi:hypothetical protein